MKSTICFKEWLLNDSRTIGSSKSDFIMTCIDLIENVNINNKTKKYLSSHTKKDEIAVNIL